MLIHNLFHKVTPPVTLWYDQKAATGLFTMPLLYYVETRLSLMSNFEQISSC